MRTTLKCEDGDVSNWHSRIITGSEGISYGNELSMENIVATVYEELRYTKKLCWKI